jgi:hypothetical protein
MPTPTCEEPAVPELLTDDPLKAVGSMLSEERGLARAWIAGEMPEEEYFARMGSIAEVWKTVRKKIRRVALVEDSGDAACAVAVASMMLGQGRRGEAWFTHAERFAPGNAQIALFREIARQLLPVRRALMRSREGFLRRLVRTIIGR